MKKLTLSILLVSSFMLFFVLNTPAEIALKGIGGQLGIVLPDGEADTTLGLGVVGDLGTITPQVRLEGTVDYWGDSWEVPGYEWSWMTIIIGGTAKYDFTTGGSFTPFAGGGLGLAISRWSSEWTAGIDESWWGASGVDTSDTDLDIAFHVCGGVDIPVGSNMKFTGQAKYVINGHDTIWLTGAILVQLY
ncbi:outer membrane beta-barrel protein [Candidatus Poribacteria bacterium]|nr:outer membrane beta-barrel protein [Candidatus Poribacteria bacterium]